MDLFSLRNSLTISVLVTFCVSITMGQQESIQISPRDVTVREGREVRLPCVLQQPGICNVYWYRKDMQTYFFRNAEFMPRIPSEVSERYSIPGNTSAGDFTLRIVNVSSWDDGEYQCACYAPSHKDTLTSDPARLQVLIAPSDEYPICEVRKRDGLLLPGDEVELICRSTEGSPPVQLAWYKGDQRLHSEMSWNYEIVAKHRTVVTLQENLSHFYCKAEGDALLIPRNCTVDPVAMAAPPPVQIDSNLQKVWQEFESGTLPLTGGQPRSQDMIELSFTCGPSTNFSREVNNFTWYVNQDPIRPGTFGYILENNGRTLRVTDLSILYSEIDVEIVCELSNNGWTVSNSTTVVSLNGNILGKPTDAMTRTELPTVPDTDIIINKRPGKWRLWPIWLLIVCVLMSLFLLILLAIYAPVICGCKKKKSKKSHAHCHHGATTKSEFHYTHSQGCSTLRTSRDTLNVYELPESERGGSDQQRQQVQATLHVVVHSANHSSNSPVDSQPVISTAETIVSSDYTTENCLATASSKAVGNYYHPDLGHYQKVRPGARPAHFNSQLLVPPSPKPHPPARTDSLEPHYQHPRSHMCCMNKTWGHNVRHEKPLCNHAPLTLSSQPDVTEGCYVRTLPLPPNEVKKARLVYMDNGQLDQVANGTVYSDVPLDDVDNIYENIAGEEAEKGNKQTLV
ncbi:uncharacterized protein LOC121413650 [Lytechinus variegatus]|uniref:uncharacterized protein LOC121413650 n=1 Tax=Lytechinus variegatus TaxID=7654 RepID=UPI001BB26906|nr:uncharacterized protein LOC121413650 [Lytechinus variegatus]